jgi:hypothetical protein
VSRRPRAPLSLRALAREGSIAPELAIEAETQRLPDPVPDTVSQRIDPPVSSCEQSLLSDVAATPAFELAPLVDVLPATLVSSVFALRRVDLRFAPPVSQHTALPAAESRGVPVPQLAGSVSAQPAAALVRHVRPLDVETLDRPLLRGCLEHLFRASGAQAPGDLSLIGIYDRVPLGAIAGAATTPHGLELRLRGGAKARRGLLVVGRRRSTGALVTAEVGTDDH